MTATLDLDDLRVQFGERFGSTPRFFQAPGRVNLIGEHTDYNNGFVLPAAIDFQTRIAAAPNKQHRIRVHSKNLGESAEMNLSNPPEARGEWSDYVFGVALILTRSGYAIQGTDLLIDSAVPLGSGLSSSAALEVSTALSLLSCSNLRASAVETALLCQRAENEFVGARVGIMDQLTACLGREGRALLIDCRSLAIQHVPLPANVGLLVCNTMVRHNLAAGEYNNRRDECERAVQVLSEHMEFVHSLRDLSVAELERHRHDLDEVLYRRCRHVVTENERVLTAAAALERSDSVLVGGLMKASHRSLRDDYEVSCRELDIAAELANALPGVFGSRMMGGGFGGCTISLVERSAVERVAENLRAGYQAQTGIAPDMYVCSASGGASEEFE